MFFFRLFWPVSFLFFLTSCLDVVTWETKIYGPYYVASDPAASYKTLFYRRGDIDLDRFENVSRVGYNSGYIFIKSEDKYYWFAVAKDPQTDLGDPATQRIVSKPLTLAEFNHLLSTLGIENPVFQFQE